MSADSYTRAQIFQRLAQWMPREIAQPELLSSRGLKDVGRKKHTIIPGQRASASWILVVSIGDQNWTAVVPEDYQKNMATTPIHRLDVLWRAPVYRGTLFRAVHYQENGIRHYIVQDVITIRGNDVICYNYDYRLSLVCTLIKSDLRTRGQVRIHTTLAFSSSIEDMQSLYSLINQDALRRLKSLIFYPQSWGGKCYIYHVTEGDLGADTGSHKTLYLQKTGRPDVYLLRDMGGEDMGTALIPNSETSKMCREILAESERVKVRCRNDRRTGKWIPVVGDN